MVKPEDSEAQLRAELLSAAKAVAEGGGEESLARAEAAIAALRGVARRSSDPPEAFLCPIYGKLMRDPVVVSSGQTYDRTFIQPWLKAGNRECPKTKQVLDTMLIFPNDFAFQMISEWCKNHDVLLPPIEKIGTHVVTEPVKCQLDKLLEMMVTLPLITDKSKAVKELRLLTKCEPSSRALLGEKAGAISSLLSLLSLPNVDHYPDLKEDLVTTIMNISILEDNKKKVVEDPQALPLLIHAVKSGTMVSRSNAAAALFTLSAIDENKVTIANSGAMGPLLKLLQEGSVSAKQDAMSAIYSLCLARANHEIIVKDGIIKVMLKCIQDSVHLAECLAIVAILSGNLQAVEELCESDRLLVILDVFRNADSGRNSENAVVALYNMCVFDQSILQEVWEEEIHTTNISCLAEHGTPRARRKARGILQRLKRLSGGSSKGSSSKGSPSRTSEISEIESTERPAASS